MGKLVHMRYVVDFYYGVPDGMSEEEYKKYMESFGTPTDFEEGEIELEEYTPYEVYSKRPDGEEN